MTMDLYVHVTDEFKQEELKKLDMVFTEKDFEVMSENGVKMG